MTKKYSYFKSELTDLFVISDGLHKETFSGIDDEYNCSRIVRKLNTLTDENEQLKQFKEKVFTWIDIEIARNEEAIEWGKETGADSGSIEFYNHMLYRLKKELEE